MRAPRGQALVLASLLVLILAVAMLSTASIGRGVNERVRLQTAADATAYSMATAEARAFNWYAFSNRTHASHLVNAMSWQSMLSFAFFTEAFSVDVLGVMKTLAVCARPNGAMGAACVVLQAIPAIGAFLRFVAEAVHWYQTLVYAFVVRPLAQSDVDRVVGRQVIPLYGAMNRVLAVASRDTFAAALDVVAAQAQSLAAANDPRATVLAGPDATACLFNRAHMRAALDPRGEALSLEPRATADADAVAMAKRAMASVANATRFACPSCPPGAVTSRTALPGVAGLADVPALLTLVPKAKWGQTKLLTFGNAVGRDVPNGGNRIRDWKDAPGAPIGMLAQGDALGSDDVYSLSVGPALPANPFWCSPTADPTRCWGDPRRGLHPDRTLPYRYMLKTSIWALHPSDGPSVHWRLVTASGPFGPGAVPPNTSEMALRRVGLNRFDVAVGPLVLEKYVANVRGVQDGNHPWEGLAAFPHFEAGAFFAGCGDIAPSPGHSAPRRDDFNQPSSWALLQKAPRASGPTLGAFDGHVLADDGSRTRFAGQPGMHAAARAITYYHRPGNWAEAPNFFNPYWRPRLAPILGQLHQVPLAQQWVDELAPAALAAPERWVTH